MNTCNFRCSYCLYTSNAGGQRTHSSKTMTWETARKAILFLRDHSVDSPDVYVAFYGGEPFLAFDMMKRAVEFAEEVFRGKTLKYTLTTNAVLLNDEALAFVEKHGIDIIISIDGTKEAHDKNRLFAKDGSGTFDAVIEKILYICENYPKLARRLMLNMVIDPSYNYDVFNKLFVKYPRLKKLSVMSSLIDDSGALQSNVVSEEYTKRQEYHQFLGYLAAYGKFPMKSLSKPLQGSSTQIFGIGKYFNPVEHMPQKSAPGGPCVPGEERLLVTADGKFVVCEKVNEISDCMIMGDIDNGIDMDKVHGMLNVAKVTEEQCKNCWAFFGCTQCGKLADRDGQFSAEERLRHCARTRRSFANTLREKAMLEDMQMFYGQGALL